MAEFDHSKVKVIDRYSSFLKMDPTLAKRRWLTYRTSKPVQPFWLHPHTSVKKFLKKEKKNEPLWCFRSAKFSHNQILLDYLGWWQSITPHIFSIGWLGCLWQGVKLCHFQCKPQGWPLQLLYYRNTYCDKLVYLAKTLDIENVGRSD